MRVWLRLTSLFGLTDEAGLTDNLYLDSLAPILRADGHEIVEAPLPGQFRELLNQLERRERNTRTRNQAIKRRRQVQAAVFGSKDNATVDTIGHPSSMPANSDSLTNTAATRI